MDFFRIKKEEPTFNVIDTAFFVVMVISTCYIGYNIFSQISNTAMIIIKGWLNIIMEIMKLFFFSIVITTLIGITLPIMLHIMPDNYENSVIINTIHNSKVFYYTGYCMDHLNVQKYVNWENWIKFDMESNRYLFKLLKISTEWITKWT